MPVSRRAGSGAELCTDHGVLSAYAGVWIKVVGDYVLRRDYC